MPTNMKVVMLGRVADVKKKKQLMLYVSLFLPSLSHTVELIEAIKILGYFLLH